MRTRLTALADMLETLKSNWPWLECVHVQLDMPTAPYSLHSEGVATTASVVLSVRSPVRSDHAHKWRGLGHEEPQSIELAWDVDERWPRGWSVGGQRCPECFDVATLIDGACVECGGPSC